MKNILLLLTVMVGLTGVSFENRSESEGKVSVAELVHRRPHVTIDSTDSLVVYYPNFKHVDLVTEIMPDSVCLV